MMVRDRMPDLCASRSNSTTFARGFLQDVHIQIAQNKKLKEVLQQVEEVRGLMELLVSNIRIVKDLQNNVLSHTNTDMQKELDLRADTISQTASCIQRKLKAMREHNSTGDFSNTDNVKQNPAYVRIKSLQYTTMLRMFSDAMEDYNMSLIRYHDKCSQLLRQQKLLLKKHLKSDESEETDSMEKNLFIDNILEDSQIAKEQLFAIQVRHDTVLKLEKSIHEVKEMFDEVAFLIEKQGEQINSVEYFARKTTDNVDSGRQDLSKAEHRSDNYRKRKAKLWIILGIIIIIFLLITIFCLK